MIMRSLIARIGCYSLLLLTTIHTVAILSHYNSESYIRARVVKLTSHLGSCSGTQVRAPSGKDYVLSAGHCSVLAENGAINASVDGGREVPLRVIEVSASTDLMLLEGMPGLKGIKLGKEPKIGDTFYAFTHGQGLRTYRSEGEYVDLKVVRSLDHVVNTPEEEAACKAQPKFKVMDVPLFLGIMLRACVLELEEYVVTMPTVAPGSSGGYVGDHMGQLIGVVSMGNERFAMLVTLPEIKEFLRSY